MSSLKKEQIIPELYNAMRDTCKATLETSYGLIIQISPDSSSIANLKGPVLVTQDTDTQGYKYRMFPDYGTGLLWYDSSWNRNPEGEFEVDEDDITKRYGQQWHNAYDKWVDKYTKAFELQEAHLGSYKQPFPEITERKSWVLEGLLLATWLSLQPDVCGVEYMPQGKKVVLQKQLLEPTLQLFFKDLDKYST
jgi:hypothetical protein